MATNTTNQIKETINESDMPQSEKDLLNNALENIDTRDGEDMTLLDALQTEGRVLDYSLGADGCVYNGLGLDCFLH